MLETDSESMFSSQIEVLISDFSGSFEHSYLRVPPEF